MRRLVAFSFYMLILASCGRTCVRDDSAMTPVAVISECRINGKIVPNGGRIAGVPPDDITLELYFSEPVDIASFSEKGIRLDKVGHVGFDLGYGESHRSLILRLRTPLEHLTPYSLYINKGVGLGVELADSYRYDMMTGVDPAAKFPEISDEELLTLVQRKTFSYFWDYAHPVSGLARERLGSGDVVTSGGSGFGIMAIPVGIERGFITREEGASRLLRVVRFLNDKAERFHGAYPHWLDGTTGKALPFSLKDDGGDLVETALLIQGLLAAGSYFNTDAPVEVAIRRYIGEIWKTVEWNWYLNGQERLFWHWSPEYGWDMDLPVTGWNEALITYVLAASSPSYPISRSDYDIGWARDGAMANTGVYYDIYLPLGPDFGGPLFFAQYSFLGLDPRGLSDDYADYWEQNVAHTQINYKYCVSNPKGWYGYGPSVWGLTASDIPGGYAASSPTEDSGTIAPTAALSSMPYAPEESMAALRYYYYILGDRLFGEYGFYDAFDLDAGWFASSYLAIDQGPIIIMIENFRSGLLWKLFMSNADVQSGLKKLDFVVEK